MLMRHVDLVIDDRRTLGNDVIARLAPSDEFQAADTSVVVQIQFRKEIVGNARQKKWTQRFSFRRSHGVHVGLEVLLHLPL
jgi:hypothetical protein